MTGMMRNVKKCKDSITKKVKEGKVIIIDMVVEKDNENHEAFETQLFLDMLMMVVPVGKERNEKEWIELIFSTGFSDYKITPILGLRSVIEVYHFLS
ncbi:hypothetical protein RYX36_034547 [Vicia faba]